MSDYELHEYYNRLDKERNDWLERGDVRFEEQRMREMSQPVYCGCGHPCEWTLLGDEYWWVCTDCGELVAQ